MTSEWEHITLDEFVQIRAVLGDQGRTQEEKMVGLAAVVEGVSEDTILNMPLPKVQPVFARVRGLDSLPPRSKARRQYQVGGWSLRVSEAQDMSVAQWIDFQNYYREDFEKHLKDILSVALVPLGKTYNEGYDMGKLKGDLGGMRIGDALAVCFFFQKRWLRSTERTLNYWVGLTWMRRQKVLTRAALALRREVSAMRRSL